VDETNDVSSSTGNSGADVGATPAFVLPLLGGYELQFSRNDFEFAQRLFAILDTENEGFVSQTTVQEFTTLRCPVFWRRDEDLRKLSVYNSTHSSSSGSGLPSQESVATSTAPFSRNKTIDSPTFIEIWTSVCSCARDSTSSRQATSNADGMRKHPSQRMGLEGWLVFCRFIALAQYLEAKRRFSARHLQQTMRHRNSPRGSEMVVVDVPPPQAPAALTLQALIDCEERAGAPLPVPELDLDHSLLAVHDAATGSVASTGGARRGGVVHVQLIGQTGALLLGRLGGSSTGTTSSFSSSSSAALDFAISYAKNVRKVPSTDDSAVVVVRRSMSDLKWLDDSFATQKVLGGTLCGRILPVFPAATRSGAHLLRGSDDTSASTSNLLTNTTHRTLKVAKKGFNKIGGAAKSLLGSTMQVGSMLVSSATPLPALPPSNEDPSTAGVSSSRSTSQNTASVPSTSTATRPCGSKPPRSTTSSNSSNTSFESFYNAHSPAAKARQIERYLNYLLEHPALSTSFPLNTILMVRNTTAILLLNCFH
jgi:hypothetical protein